MTFDLFSSQKEAIELFTDEMRADMLHIKTNVKTKKEVMANLDQWLSTIDSIKDTLRNE